MTLKQFLEKLSTTSGWELTPMGCIRRRHPELHQQCPITAVAGMGNVSMLRAGQSIGLKATDIARIMTAADLTKFDDRQENLAALRRRLLKACRLEETTGKR
jgi:hypothetical protein